MHNRVVRFAILTNSKKSWNDLFNMTIDRARILAMRDQVCVIIHDGAKDLIVVREDGMLEEIKCDVLKVSLTDHLAEKVVEGNCVQQRHALGVARLIMGSSIEIQGYENRKVLRRA